jgi:hypothetical protein
MPVKRFPAEVASRIDAIKYMRIRSGDHRFIAVWVVVPNGRVLVRSWNDKPDGWQRAFLEEPRGAIVVDGEEVPVRAVPVRSARLIALADEAYASKYTTKSNQTYVKGFRSRKRRATTMELVPR